MVKAVETSRRELLDGAKRYQVPLRRRTYEWKTQQLARLPPARSSPCTSTPGTLLSMGRRA